MLATAVATAAGTATPTARAASTHTRVDTIGRRCRLEMGSGDSIEIYGWLSRVWHKYATAQLWSASGWLRRSDESGAVAVRKKLKGKVKSADP